MKKEIMPAMPRAEPDRQNSFPIEMYILTENLLTGKIRGFRGFRLPSFTWFDPDSYPRSTVPHVEFGEPAAPRRSSATLNVELE